MGNGPTEINIICEEIPNAKSYLPINYLGAEIRIREKGDRASQGEKNGHLGFW